MLQFAVPRRTFALLAAAGLLGISLAIALAERARVDLIASNQWVLHTIEVQQTLHGLLASVLDTENACGGLAAGDAAGPAACERSQRLVHGQLANLTRLTADNAGQQRRLGTLSARIAARMKELEPGAGPTVRGTAGEAARDAANARGRSMIGDVRALVQAGADEEQRLLAVRATDLQAAVRRRTALMRGLIVCLVLATATLLYLWVRVTQLTPFVTLCAWSRTVKLGNEWVSFEEYLRRQFDITVSHAVSPKELAKMVEEHGLG